MDAGELARRSVEIIRAGQAPSGSYVACPTFAPYRYCWLRDGAFIADAMSRVGEVDSAEAFFDWCAGVIAARADEIEAGGRLHARYTLAGRESEEQWPTFQLDGYGLWLWSLAEHRGRHSARVDRWAPAVDLTRRFLEGHLDEPCVDWWEEREGVHVTTLACVEAGLAAWGGGGRVDPADGEPRLDASLLVLPFLGFPAARLGEIEAALVSPGGGVHRHLDDVYYGGGEWLLLTALLGWVYADQGREDEARRKLDWIVARATPAGELPEQVSDHLLAPEQYDAWLARWGPPACPLLWSHATFLVLVQRLGALAA